MMSGRAARLAALLLVANAAAFSQDWREYGGGPDQSKYVVMKDITKANVSKLAVDWMYPSGDERSYQFSPVR
jgi:glucose dehydrogenase